MADACETFKYENYVYHLALRDCANICEMEKMEQVTPKTASGVIAVYFPCTYHTNHVYLTRVQTTWNHLWRWLRAESV